ncbi:MAG: DUF1801 domain-containing protein [candidate division Zixibacteria bacterium]|nr:DUF1801 domain-containing protein [candidate division Zixibacteria bacterium]
MAEPKTRPTKASVTKFLATIPDDTMRKDAKKLVALMQTATAAKPQMWGSAIVGFGTFRLKYASGRELDWPLMGFSPRKQALTLYLPDLRGLTPFLKRLGKHKTSKSCLYIKSLADVDMKVLEEMITASAHSPGA